MLFVGKLYMVLLFWAMFVLYLIGEVIIMKEKAMAPHSSTLAWKSHGWRSLVGYSPWGLKQSDSNEWLHFHFSLSCIGKGNGNPLQCSCLENPRDGGAWWAAVYVVAQSRTQLKQLSSSSSSREDDKAEGLSLIGDRGQAPISLTSDVNDTDSDSLLNSILSILLKKMTSDVWVIALFFLS